MDPKAQLRGEDKPLKVNDHGVDALRYGVAPASEQRAPSCRQAPPAAVALPGRRTDERPAPARSVASRHDQPRPRITGGSGRNRAPHPRPRPPRPPRRRRPHRQPSRRADDGSDPEPADAPRGSSRSMVPTAGAGTSSPRRRRRRIPASSPAAQGLLEGSRPPPVRQPHPRRRPPVPGSTGTLAAYLREIDPTSAPPPASAMPSTTTRPVDDEHRPHRRHHRAERSGRRRPPPSADPRGMDRVPRRARQAAQQPARIGEDGARTRSTTTSSWDGPATLDTSVHWLFGEEGAPLQVTLDNGNEQDTAAAQAWFRHRPREPGGPLLEPVSPPSAASPVTPSSASTRSTPAPSRRRRSVTGPSHRAAVLDSSDVDATWTPRTCTATSWVATFRTEAAAKGADKRAGLERHTFTPDDPDRPTRWEIIVDRTDKAGRWLRIGQPTIWPWPWPRSSTLRTSPPGQFWGRSDIDAVNIALTRAGIARASDLNRTARIHAHPTVTAKGMTPAQVQNIDLGNDKITALPGPDMSLDYVETPRAHRRPSVGSANFTTSSASTPAHYSRRRRQARCRRRPLRCRPPDLVRPCLLQSTSQKRLTYGRLIRDLTPAPRPRWVAGHRHRAMARHPPDERPRGVADRRRRASRRRQPRDVAPVPWARPGPGGAEPRRGGRSSSEPSDRAYTDPAGDAPQDPPTDPSAGARRLASPRATTEAATDAERAAKAVKAHLAGSTASSPAPASSTAEPSRAGAERRRQTRGPPRALHHRRSHRPRRPHHERAAGPRLSAEMVRRAIAPPDAFTVAIRDASRAGIEAATGFGALPNITRTDLGRAAASPAPSTPRAPRSASSSSRSRHRRQRRRRAPHHRPPHRTEPATPPAPSCRPAPRNTRSRANTIARTEILRAQRGPPAPASRTPTESTNGSGSPPPTRGRAPCVGRCTAPGTPSPRRSTATRTVGARWSPPFPVAAPTRSPPAMVSTRHPPLEEQRKILGPKRHELWAEGRQTLGDMVGRRSNGPWGTMRTLNPIDAALDRRPVVAPPRPSRAEVRRHARHPPHPRGPRAWPLAPRVPRAPRPGPRLPRVRPRRRQEGAGPSVGRLRGRPRLGRHRPPAPARRQVGGRRPRPPHPRPAPRRRARVRAPLQRRHHRRPGMELRQRHEPGGGEAHEPMVGRHRPAPLRPGAPCRRQPRADRRRAPRVRPAPRGRDVRGRHLPRHRADAQDRRRRRRRPWQDVGRHRQPRSTTSSRPTWITRCRPPRSSTPATTSTSSAP